MSSTPDVSCDDCGSVFSDIMEGRGKTVFHQLVRKQVETREGCQRCFSTYQKTAELCRTQLRRVGAPQLGERLMQYLRDKTASGD